MDNLKQPNQIFICNNYRKVDGIFVFDKQTGDEKWDKVEKINEALHDAYAKEYSQENKPNILSDENYREIRNNVAEILKGATNPKILDIGCGTGFILRACSKFSNNLYGVDISLEMLKKARDIGATLVKSSAASLPFPDNFFDLVTIHSTLHHFQEIEPVLKEARRVLAPGGYLYTDHDPNRSFFRYFGWYIWLRNKRKYGRRLSKKIYSSSDIGMNEIRLSEYQYLVKHGFSEEQLRSALLEQGFSSIKIGFHFPVNPDRFTKSLIFFNRIFRKNNFKYYIFSIARKE